MSRVWYCATCGYEVSGRGRCHSCGEKLVASALPELRSQTDDDEVGYRLEGWRDSDRGRLIELLNDLEILHRFEGDELVVAAEDEGTVDDLVAELGSGEAGSGRESRAEQPEKPEAGSLDGDAEPSDALTSAVVLLADAASRLRADPTDMHADADVAEASTAVFFADGFPGVDDDTWAAVGRVTRRLLGALGAEEALEDTIRSEAGVLARMLEPIAGRRVGGLPRTGPNGEGEVTDQTVYDLADWLPDQRARLGLLLDEEGLPYEWEGGDLVVPAADEERLESLFDRLGAPDDDADDGGEIRYHAIEELFAATGRLAAEPSDEQRAEAVVLWVREADGPPPLGMDEVHWLRIASRARALADAIEGGLDADLIGEEAAALNALLRTVV